MTCESYPDRPIIGGRAPRFSAAMPTLMQSNCGHEPLERRHGVCRGASCEVGEHARRWRSRVRCSKETGLVVDVGPHVEESSTRIIPDAAGRVQYHFVIVDYLCRVTDGRARMRIGCDAGRVGSHQRSRSPRPRGNRRAVVEKAVWISGAFRLIAFRAPCAADFTRSSNRLAQTNSAPRIAGASMIVTSRWAPAAPAWRRQ